jgi:RNA polymerase subunit RPABC4/transcription elongation factor Spt4
MNRSIVLVGVGIIVAGFALVASPIVLTGSEQFDVEQEAGIFLSPVGLLVVLIGAVQVNPQLTTVGGTFGNPEANPQRATPTRTPDAARPTRGFSPREPVHCRYCRTVIAYDLAFCPRCARPRECRGCGRLLGVTENRTDCPGCHREEAFCNCPRLARAPSTVSVGPSRGRRG